MMPANPTPLQSSDFGKRRRLGSYDLMVPVCVDALGETWAGHSNEGSEQGRLVLITELEADRLRGVLPGILAAVRHSAQLRHPNVLAFLDLVDTGTHLGLVSEYLEGEPLPLLLRSAGAQLAPFSQGVTLRIALDVVQTWLTLRQRDEKAVCFGGFSPEMVFVASFGEALLRHPGISAAAICRRELITHPACIGYRAPEQWQNGELITEAADVFSLGVVLWEMLTATPLFGGRSYAPLGHRKTLSADRIRQVERRSLEMDIPRLDQIQRAGGALHSEVVDLIARMLDRNPQTRIQNFTEVSAALQNLPSGLLSDNGEVSGAVERLAGRTISKRQKELSRQATASYASSLRPTSHPQSGERVRVDIPPHPDPELSALLRASSRPPRHSSSRPPILGDDTDHELGFGPNEARTIRRPVGAAIQEAPPLEEAPALDEGPPFDAASLPDRAPAFDRAPVFDSAPTLDEAPPLEAHSFEAAPALDEAPRFAATPVLHEAPTLEEASPAAADSSGDFGDETESEPRQSAPSLELAALEPADQKPRRWSILAATFVAVGVSAGLVVLAQSADNETFQGTTEQSHSRKLNPAAEAEPDNGTIDRGNTASRDEQRLDESPDERKMNEAHDLESAQGSDQPENVQKTNQTAGSAATHSRLQSAATSKPSTKAASSKPSTKTSPKNDSTHKSTANDDPKPSGGAFRPSGI